MTDHTVTTLTAATTLDGTELLYAVQSSADTKATTAQVKTFTSASPTLVTPNLGTPTAGVLTSCTGLPAVGGGTGQSTYAKGDLLASPGSNTLNKLPVGTDTHVLTADAASTNGVKWAAASGGGSMAIGGTVTSGTTGSILFVGAGPVLAQDNAEFTWDNTNFSLDIGGVPALYRVPNANGDNWFEGGAGNFTTTGYQNFGTGDGCLSDLTTGFGNTGLGANALTHCDSGNNNMAIGAGSLSQVLSGSGNVAIGEDALRDTTATDNVAIGRAALIKLTASPGFQNTAIGAQAAINLLTGELNVFIGSVAANNLTGGSDNVFVGPGAGYFLNGTSGKNTWIGGYPGTAANYNNTLAFSDGDGNLFLDYHITNASTWTSPKAICVTPVAVASLPTAGIMGRRHFVTNATATTFASIVAGGGGNPVPVYDDGTNWRIG